MLQNSVPDGRSSPHGAVKIAIPNDGAAAAKGRKHRPAASQAERASSLMKEPRQSFDSESALATERTIRVSSSTKERVYAAMLVQRNSEATACARQLVAFGKPVPVAVRRMEGRIELMVVRIMRIQKVLRVKMTWALARDPRCLQAEEMLSARHDYVPMYPTDPAGQDED